MLTDDERARSARFRFERDRRRFIVARGALRKLLGRYLGMHPADIRFVYNSFGKPELSPASGSHLRFNLSHSADLALIAIAADADIGVDVEYIRPQPQYAEIAKRFLSPIEVDYLDGLPSHFRDEAFFSFWTKQEACVKARGDGLELDGASHAPDPARQWSLYEMQPAPGYVGALVIEGSGWRVRQRRWEEGYRRSHRGVRPRNLLSRRSV